MSFDDVARNFECSGSGSDAFKALHHSLLDLMRIEPHRAAGYFILASAVRSYVMRYEDQAVPPELADGAKVIIEDFIARLRAAWAAASADELQTLNKLAFDYEWNVRDF